MLCNIWHGFWVRSLWPRVLWQAVTLWWVNRDMTAPQGSREQQVCNRKETTWWEPRSQIWDKVQRIVVERGTHSRSEASLTTLQGGTSVGTPWLLEEDMGRRSPLSDYISLHLSLLSTNRGPFSRIKWEIYFHKEMFRSFIIFSLVLSLRLCNSNWSKKR